MAVASKVMKTIAYRLGNPPGSDPFPSGKGSAPYGP